jgi:hypothetical protein
MQITDRRTLGPGFDRKLKTALDSVAPRTPHHFNARYRRTMWVRSRRPRRAWRLAPALIGVAAVGIMGLSAVAATGSSDLAVWTRHAASTMPFISHIPDNQPQAPAPDPRGNAPVSQPPAAATQATARPVEGSDKAKAPAKAQESTRPEESPRPTDRHEQPSPSPKPPEGGQESAPSPPPHESGGH